MENSSCNGRKRKELQEVVYQVDDDSDTSDSSTTNGSRPRRRKFKYSGGGSETKSCHQCKRNDKGVDCTKCEKKRYCVSCISRYYPKMNEEDFVNACPFCQDICNCTSCLRLELPIKNNSSLSEEDKVHHAKCLLKRLLPYVRQFNEQQIMEREREAKIQGLSMSDLKVQVANCYIDERMNCDYCRTSIADYHRSCTRCSYDLCMTCCQELRDCCLHVRQKKIMEYVDPGVGYLHGETPSNQTLGTTTETKDGDDRRSESEWKLNKDGSISCPPESIGGCGIGILKLNQVLPDNWLSNMLIKAEKLYELYKLNDMPEIPAHWCTCHNLACDNNAQKKLREAASGDNSDDYLYSPSVIHIQAGDLKHFQAHWLKGEPVIVKNVLDSTYGLSWEPMVMSRAIHEKSQTGVTVINCLNWCEEDYSVDSFFKGYAEGILDLSEWPQMLKLNDWPPSDLFKEHLPRHNVEFISALPFKEYTHPQSGYLNLAVKLPDDHLMPDIGPKLYAAYGFSQELGRGDSVMKISCHESDVVYVLTHTKKMTFTPSELAEIKQLKEKHYLQDQREIFINEKFGNGLEQQERNDIEESGNVDGGALWDIYRREDAFKLKEYLRKHFKEFRHTYCLLLKQVFDPIHDGAFYLNTEHKKRLKKEYGIEPWTVVQNLGDAVFIPAGCPYQVRNLKVSTGFVSPENVEACLSFAEEIRVLPQEHGAKEDKLGVKKLILHAMRQVLDDLDVFTKESGYLGSELEFNPESESDFRPVTSQVYSRRRSKSRQRGIYSLRCDATRVESGLQKEANISEKASHVISSPNNSPGTGTYTETPSSAHRIELISCQKSGCVDINCDPSKESGYLGSLPGSDLDSNLGPAAENARCQCKDQREIFDLTCSAIPIESDFQKEATTSQEVTRVITETMQPLSSNDSPGSYSQASRSVSAEMIGFFKQLEKQFKENRFDVLRVLPPQIQLDEEIIQEYEKVLKKYLSGRLLDLATDSNLQDFNKVLHFLLACRRIPSHLQQGFITLRWDLPNLTSRAYELHKEVNQGTAMPLARSKEREELKSILDKYRQLEDNLVKLEQEKDANLLLIASFKMRNECLISEEVTNLVAEALKDVAGGSGKSSNDKLGKLEQMKDHNSDELGKLQASNDTIETKIIKLADEAKVLHQDAIAQNYKVINLEAMGAVHEANVENTMDRLVTMELEWKERVKSLDY